jgi:hypothetical protein
MGLVGNVAMTQTRKQTKHSGQNEGSDVIHGEGGESRSSQWLMSL